jgi:Periplasmic copper-binding protein (NosD)
MLSRGFSALAGGRAGAILSACLLAPLHLGAATYTVTNTSSSGTGSLAWAVFQANTNAGLDFINFNIPGSGIQLIRLAGPLDLTDQVVINAESQPGYSGSPLIYIPGSQSIASLFVLQNGSGSTIQGLGMYDYTAAAVTIFSSSVGNWVQDNWIGFYISSGSIYRTYQDFPPPYYYPAGVAIQSSFNTIRNNTISGVYNGVVIGEDITKTWSGTVYKTNSIQGNKIGTDPTGSGIFVNNVAYGNDWDGVFLGAGAQQNFIGPTNVLSGNQNSGCELLHSSVTGNVVFRNSIGTDLSGSVALPNYQLGVLLANGAWWNAVGGPFGGNIISGNTQGGISLGSTGYPYASSNWVQYNVIGLNAAQTQAVGEQGVGVSILSGAQSNVIGANVIAGNSSHGVVVQNATGNDIAGNWIGENASLAPKPNGGWDAVFLTGGSYNFLMQNAFGPNLLGSYTLSAGAVGNLVSGNYGP